MYVVHVLTLTDMYIYNVHVPVLVNIIHMAHTCRSSPQWVHFATCILMHES